MMIHAQNFYISKHLVRLCLWVGLASIVGCSADTSNSGVLENLIQRDDGVWVEQIKSRWKYRSFKVDVTITLTSETEQDSSICSTTGRLSVDKASASKKVHTLQSTPCEQLELTQQGDILMNENSTHINWTEYSINLVESTERVYLGPTTTEVAGESIQFEFSLIEGVCDPVSEVEPECKCITLTRKENDLRDVFEIERGCEE
jgi:hypothetical protein